METTTTSYRLPPRVKGTQAGNTARYILQGPLKASKRRLGQGGAVSVEIPGFGVGVSVTDPALIKQVYTAPADVIHAAVRRSILWAERCKAHHTRADQSQFAIVQGGTNLALREECARELVATDFPGYALGGFSVGEGPEAMHAALPSCVSWKRLKKPCARPGSGSGAKSATRHATHEAVAPPLPRHPAGVPGAAWGRRHDFRIRTPPGQPGL